MKRALLRVATIIAAALAIGAISASSATASPLPLRFSVPSGDNCTYGLTEGQIQWSSYPAQTVLLTGTIADRPYPNDPTAVCRDDGRYTIARYTAYAGNRVLDQAGQRVDNAVIRFRIALDAGIAEVGIDRITIQVCRASLTAPSPSPDYCGRLYTFTPAVITP